MSLDVEMKAGTEVTRKRCLWSLKSKPGRTDQISKSMDFGWCSLDYILVYGMSYSVIQP